ncbi:hypothetical protein [Sphingomonas gellani]|nr:hypothetical protein [Sphingomonas gellani]
MGSFRIQVDDGGQVAEATVTNLKSMDAACREAVHSALLIGRERSAGGQFQQILICRVHDQDTDESRALYVRIDVGPAEE